MPISGLVLTLDTNSDLRQRTWEALEQHPGIDVGTWHEDRLPIVTDSPDEQADRELWDWLQALPGVLKLEIAVIHFENEPAGGEGE
jgi:hypothetical protein